MIRYRPSSSAPGPKRPWLIESDEVSQPLATPPRHREGDDLHAIGARHVVEQLSGEAPNTRARSVERRGVDRDPETVHEVRTLPPRRSGP